MAVEKSPYSRLHHHSALWVLLFLLLFFTFPCAAQQCDENTPCEVGCCSQFNFCGFGKDFCELPGCLNNCDAKADCDPGGLGADYVKWEKCPLNVCCSKYGFCGMTEEFCGDNKPKRPSCAVNGQGFNRVVGYYEGWSKDRPCNAFYPEQIPTGIYTHLNYAFATIDPETYQVRPASREEKDLMKRLTNRKKVDPDLRVFIAIGGWTFSDPGPTRFTFSELAASASHQENFFRSLISFMSTYDFDGVDLDWEYPEAEDRGGNGDDYANFPKFLAALKSRLKGTGGRDGLSVTIPASYWYLQHFDLKKLDPIVDFFNIMSYDFHGTWDQHNKWVGPHLNSHTNLTEIKDGLDLLWRNDVSKDKVTLGMAFYGRAFTVVDPGCTAPGCTYASGGTKRQCSHEISVVLNSEIDEIMEEGGLSSTWDEDAAVKILVYEGNQWVTYDDEQTLKQKADFARSQCLGGVMVWAVSHDTKEAKYNKAFAKAANRKFTALAATDDGYIEVHDKHKQCKWTNCLEECPSGYVKMYRDDPDRNRDRELLVDDTGCGGIGNHQLCCPADEDLPSCGWYSHNNGKCDQTCPSGRIEIGSLQKHCKKNYQAACCTVASASMRIYNQCHWSSSWPDCNGGSCSSGYGNQLALSSSSSGGALCSEIGGRFFGEPQVLPREERKYCCKPKDANGEWDDCEWHDNIGAGGGGGGYCWSGCPSDKVRIAMDQFGGKCSAGARARCCTPNYTTIHRRFNPEVEDFEYYLDVLANDPYCDPDSNIFGITKRDLGVDFVPAYDTLLGSGHGNMKRQSTEHAIALQIVTKNLITLLYGNPSDGQVDVWDSKMRSKWPNLVKDKLKSWLLSSREAEEMGSTQLPLAIACNLDMYNRNVGGSLVDCICGRWDCCEERDTECINNAVDMAKRALPMEDWGFNESMSSRPPRPSSSDPELLKRHVEKRDEEYKWRVIDPETGDTVEGQVYSLDYLTFSNINIVRTTIFNRFFNYSSPMCLVPNMHQDPQPIDMDSTGLDIEHIVERNTIAYWIQNAIQGRLPSGAHATVGAISSSFFTSTIRANLADYFPTFDVLKNPAPGGIVRFDPSGRIMASLGHSDHMDVMAILPSHLNTLKSRLWRSYETSPWSDTEMEDRVIDLDPTGLMQRLRAVMSVFHYLNNAEVRRLTRQILDDVRRELTLAEDLHVQMGRPRVRAQEHFTEFMRAHYRRIVSDARTWMLSHINTARQAWADRPPSPARTWVLDALNYLQGQLANFIYMDTAYLLP